MQTLLRFLFSALGLFVAARFVPGIHGGSFLDLLIVAVILGALNATLGRLLKFLAFIPVFLSLGCFSLVINGLVFWLAGALSSKLGLGFQVSGFWAGFLGALVSGLISWFLSVVFLRKDNGRNDSGPRNIKVIN
ncbi:MAG TPA: phage holin family protein [Holophagaceae bacterium]|nr:phage holin family protein [Holophagaceae bacterium]